jgi:acetyl esterase/lipase
MTQFKKVPPFKDISATGVADMYLGREPSRPLPQYSSPIDGILTGLPPTYIETPQFDPLHDQGIDYAKAMKDVGVEVELNDIPGAIHGFDVVAPKTGVSHEAMRRRIAFLQRVFAIPSGAAPPLRL